MAGAEKKSSNLSKAQEGQLTQEVAVKLKSIVRGKSTKFINIFFFFLLLCMVEIGMCKRITYSTRHDPHRTRPVAPFHVIQNMKDKSGVNNLFITCKMSFTHVELQTFV